MKVLAEKNEDFQASGVKQGSVFQVDGAKMVLSILRNTYSDPVSATVRELCQNASEVDPDFRVHLPTALEPWFSVIDNGTGLTKEDTIKYFSGLGASTKDKDNTKVGGHGIGCKVPFSCVDDYVVIVRYQGKIITWLAYLDEFSIPQFVPQLEEDTDQPNGVEVRVPLPDVKAQKFVDAAKSQLQFFNPKPETNVPVEYNQTEYTVKSDRCGFRKSTGYPDRTNSKVIMGNLWYPLSAVSFDGKYQNAINKGVDVYLDIGDAGIPLNRESILYDDKSIKAIESAIDSALDKLTSESQVQLDKCLNRPEAYRKLYHIMDTERRFIYNSYWKPSEDTSYTWNGEPSRYLSRYIYPGVNHTGSISSYDLKNRKTLSMPGILDPVPKYEDIKDLDLNQNPSHRYDSWTKRALFEYLDVSNILLIDPDEDKRVPSTILYNFKWEDMDGDSLFDQNKNVYVIYSDDVLTLKKALEDDGYKPVLFSDLEKPEVTTKKSKKLSTVTIFTSDRYNKRDSWKDTTIENLDMDTGVYINLRNWEVHEDHKYNTRHFELIKQSGYIPIDTKLFGCPGSHKNYLEDHPNYMSIDELVESVIELAKQDAFDVGMYQKLGVIYKLVSHYELRHLDIISKTCYYSFLIRMAGKYNTLSSRKAHQLLTQLSLSYSHPSVLYNYYEGKLLSKYPLLKYMRKTPRSDTYIKDLTDYINTQERIK